MLQLLETFSIALAISVAIVITTSISRLIGRKS
jgi:hypothetical protein